MAEEKSEILWAESLYGANTRKGLVKLTFKDAEVIVSPAEARAFALSVLEAAEAAETDEIMMRWLKEKIGISTDEKAVTVLRDFRIMRSSDGLSR